LGCRSGWAVEFQVGSLPLIGQKFLAGVGDEDVAGLQMCLGGVAAGNDLDDEQAAGRQRSRRCRYYCRREEWVADGQQACAAGRRAVVEARLVTTQWPASLQVTAINADTGELHIFDRGSGIPLVDAVAASGAVPGVWPLEQIGGRSWIDGGMVSTTNARLAEGYGRVVVIAPMPFGLGAIPGAAEDLAAMGAQAKVQLIAPDERSLTAIGPNPYDPERRAPAASAGRRQGAGLAQAIAAVW